MIKTISEQYKATKIKPDREIPAASANNMFNEHKDETGIQTALPEQSIQFLQSERWLPFLIEDTISLMKKVLNNIHLKASYLGNGQNKEYFWFFQSL